MTKAEIIEKLKALGVKFNPNAKKGDLEALLPEQEEEVSEEKEEVETGSGFVTVVAADIKRVFSKAVHGGDYKKLAAKFAGKIGGIIK